MPVQPLQSALDTLRERMQAELEAQLADIGQRHAEALADARRSWEAEARQRDAPVDPRPPGSPAGGPTGEPPSTDGGPRLARLRDALGALSAATSLKAILERVAAAAAVQAPRTALFVLEGLDGVEASTFRRWTESWPSEPCPLPRTIAAGDRHVISDVARAGVPATATAIGGSSSLPSTPVNADLAVAFPLLVEGESVAVLYAEGPNGAASGAAPDWQSALEILAEHASACLALHTAVRTLQAIGVHRSAPIEDANSVEADGGSARRYARLLVSEIKLYNEAAVRAGRERRDLLARLGPEIDRARRLYEERVPATIFNRAYLFEQELVKTLAEGDPALLGAPV